MNGIPSFPGKVRKQVAQDITDRLHAIKEFTFSDYQRECITTAKYPGIGANFTYPTLGMCGETGEVAEKIKKVIRDSDGKVTPERKEELKKEIGDVLWYVAMLCTELRLELGDVALVNIKKLKSRIERGVIKGDGDNR